ncbi:VCBS domain-containing protein [Falsiroseomonas frigidaquae]|uniref:VCBS domain-containing protein n=1 Tax=Falsiroseomonas frigidaquae TaxID=487318 RepID=UPI003159073B
MWSYALDNGLAATQGLAAGEEVSETLTVTSVDGTASRTITVTVTGANDGAAISDPATGSLTEDSADTIGGTLVATDADGDEAGFAEPADLSRTYGAFSFDASTGVWSYALDNGLAATQGLAAGEEVSETLTVTSVDGTASRTITVTVTGANDGAAISGPATGSLTEDSADTIGGTLVVSDADTGEAGFAEPADLSGTYGAFSFDASTGVWSYALDNGLAATQGLAAGEEVSETLTVTSVDGTASRTITVTVTGANDATDVEQLTASEGFIVVGGTTGDLLGFSVSGLGDVNGDGVADLIVGAPAANGGTGEAYVILGSRDGFGTTDAEGRQILDVAALTPTEGFVLRAQGADALTGFAVSSAGDVNGDGFADLIISARFTDTANPNLGVAYLVFGSGSGFGATDGAGRQVVDLDALTAEQGFQLRGTYGADDAYGIGMLSIAAAGDVNGDGFDDVILGTNYAGVGGEVYVIYGAASGLSALDGDGRPTLNLLELTPSQGFVVAGGDPAAPLGLQVDSAGDVNGDGFADIIVFSPLDGAYVLFGSATTPGTPDFAGRSSVDPETLSPAAGFVIGGAGGYEVPILRISSAGDVNGDGFDDVMLTSPFGGTSSDGYGEVYVVFGRDADFGDLDGNGRQVLDLNLLTADRGFVLRGSSYDITVGLSISEAGDVNGDGFADILLSTCGCEPAGDVFVLFGSDAGFGVTDAYGRQVVDLSDLHGDSGLALRVASGATAVVAAGDVNGDGFDDLLIGGAYGSLGQPESGEAYVLFGGAFGGDSVPVDDAGDTLPGSHVGGRGDDTLSGGGGADVLRGGAGDDLLRVADANFLAIDGGTGTDTVALSGSGITLDLTGVPAPRIASVERIDLTSFGDNTLMLDRLAVLGLTEQRVGGVAIVTVDGNAGDRLELAELGWASAGTVDIGGVTYTRLVSADGSAEIRVAAAVTVEFFVPPAPVIDLAAMDAAQGFIIRGAIDDGNAGFSVSFAGDVNGDGFADVILGAPQLGSATYAGEAYVVFGTASGFGVDVGGRQVIDVATLDAAQGFIIQGAAAIDRTGYSVSSAGDVNGDGFVDLIVGAMYSTGGAPRAGTAYVVFGTASGFGAEVDGRQVIDLATLDAAQGFVIQGAAAGHRAGNSVSSVGDVNGDGFADLIVGAAASDVNGYFAGEAYVVLGGAAGFGVDIGGRQVIDVASLDATQGFVIQGSEPSGGAGASVSSAGDVNGDGFADLIVGVPFAGQGENGEAYVVFGTAAGFGVDGGGRQIIDLATLTAAQGFVIQADSAADNLGRGVSSAGDVNGDGFDDLIVGAEYDRDGGSSAGKAYVVFGTASGFGVDVGGRQVIDLATLGAAQGFIIQGDAAGDRLGRSVSSAGDVNGDGFDDLIVGARYGDDGGEAYVVFGTASGFGVDVGGRQVIDLSELGAAQGFIIQGDAAFAQAGASVSSAGDVNGDGYDDLMVGAPGNDAGEAYILFGGAFGASSDPVTTVGTAAAEMLIGGIGDDTLTGGGGLDVLRGGGGDDLLIAADAGFRVVEGGNGTDTLALSGNTLTLDLTTVPAPRIGSVERIDLTGSGNNTLVLDRLAVLGLTEQRVDGVAILMVDGNAGDTLRLTEAQWASAGTMDIGGVTYTRLVSSDGSAEIRVAAAVTVGSFVPPAPVIDVTTLDAAQGFIIQGEADFDRTGTSVSSAGDVNGDGIADMIVGAYGGAGNHGEAYVVFGRRDGFGVADGAGRQVVDARSLSPAEGFVIRGDVPGDQMGRSVSSAGDVNGDGFADLILGSFRASGGGSFAGEAYIVFGSADGFGSLVDGRQLVDLSNLSASQGFILRGGSANDRAGGSVSGGGDINGDGFADLLVGAPQTYTADRGLAYVLFGAASGFGVAEGGRQVLDLGSLSGSQGFAMGGISNSDRFGTGTSFAGDVNGDGFDDIIIGATFDDSGASEAGAAYILLGKAGGFASMPDLANLSAADGWRIQGDAAGDQTGISVHSAGDVDGDGYDDVVIGAPGGADGGTYAGEAYVLFGRATGTGRPVIDLADLAADEGFVIQGDVAYDILGASVSSAGDVNGDGFADLIVGAYGAGDEDSGRAYILFGGASGFGVDVGGRQVIDLTDLGEAQGFIIQGDMAGDRAGRGVSSAGDVNGDGYDDLMVGAPRGDDGGDAAGEAYILFGGAFGASADPVTTVGTAAAEMLIGGIGDDTLTGGGGLDVLRGGAGDDLLIAADSGFRVVEGGNGTDTLALSGNGITLDLTTVPAPRIASVEAIDLTGSGNNTLVLDRLAVLGLTEQRVDGVAILTVDGDAGDTLELTEAIWASAGTVDIGGVTYTRLVSTDGSAEIRVAAAVTVEFFVPPAPVIDLAALDAAQGFIIRGAIDDGDAGFSVSFAGDVNGDGFADVILGAPQLGSATYAGEAYVVFGTASGFGVDVGGRQVIDVATLDAAQGFIIQGAAAIDRTGYSVSSAGDVNGDGFVDLIVGAMYSTGGAPRAGTAYVVFGTASGFGAEVDGRQVIDLATLDAAQGFVIQGAAAYDHTGNSVSSAGDVNGDGFADLIVGAANGDLGAYGAGEAYVVFGGASGFGVDIGGRQVIDVASLDATQGFVIQGSEAGNRAGASVSSAGDVNGDGFADLIVGATNAGDGYTGEAYVVFGTAAGFGVDGGGRQIIDLATLTAAQGFVIQGDSAADQLGFSLSSAGDVNGDGFDDLIVGAKYGSDGGAFAGEAYVVFGTASGFGVDVGGRQVIDLTTLGATLGFIIQGDAAGDRLGGSVSSAGDVNGDGFDDLIVGARYGDDGGNLAGEAYVVFGTASGFGVDVGGRQVIDLSELAAAQGFIIQGDAAIALAGTSVSSAGDVNGDGYDDLMVGAPGNDAGEAYILFGGAFGASFDPVTTVGTVAAEMLVGGIGDDTLTGGGGLDVLRGGAGDDLLIAADAGFRVVEGGNGTDTLALSGNALTLDLTTVPAPRIGSVERIDLTGSGGNTLVLDRLAVLGLTEQRVDGVAILMVDGNAGDTLRLTEAQWGNAGTIDIGGVTYTRQVSTDGSAEIRVAAAVTRAFPGGDAAISAATLTPDQGLVIRGEGLGHQLGSAISLVGDLNADGYQDSVLAARGSGGSGAAYVLFGGPAGSSRRGEDGRQVFDLIDLDAGQGFLVLGDENLGEFGNSAASAGDVNGDGIDDLIMGAIGADGGGENAGAAYVIFGTTEGFGTLVGGRRVIDLTDLTPAQGFIIEGNVPDGAAGSGVSGIGDVNGDGLDDLLVGVRGTNTGVVVFGSASGFGSTVDGRQVLDLGTLSPAQGFIMGGEFGNIGSAVLGGGDINGDGRPDLVLGAPLSGLAAGFAGAMYVVFGQEGSPGSPSGGQQVLDLATLAPAQGFVVLGDELQDVTGSILALSDINGDGFDDLIVSGYRGDRAGSNQVGNSYVVFGGGGAFGTLVDGRQVLDLTTLSGAQGFVIQGQDADALLGFGLAAAGDVNGDGFEDLIIGSRYGGPDGSGDAYVIFGGADGFGTAVDGRQVIDLATLAPENGFRLLGEANGDQFGRVVSAAGDVNADGFDDLFVGAQYANGTAAESGQTYIVYGGAFGGSVQSVIRATGGASTTLAGGAGNDILMAEHAGAVLLGGAGDDLLLLSSAAADFFRLSGGNGVDTIVFDQDGLAIDLTTIPETRLSGIEAFNLAIATGATLGLSAQDVMALTDTPHAGFTGADAAHRLVIDGNATSTIRLYEGVADQPTLVRDWTLIEQDQTLGGQDGGAYDYWALSDGVNDLAVLAIHNSASIIIDDLIV